MSISARSPAPQTRSAPKAWAKEHRRQHAHSDERNPRRARPARRHRCANARHPRAHLARDPPRHCLTPFYVQELAAVAVVYDVFEQCLARTLRDAALDLPLRLERVDDDADVVDHGVAVERDLAGFEVDLDPQMWQPLGKVGTSGENPPAPCRKDTDIRRI